MGMFDYIDSLEFYRVWKRIYFDDRDEGFVAITPDGKLVVAYDEVYNMSFVMDYTREHEPVQADAFMRLHKVSSIDFNSLSTSFKVEQLDDEQRSIVADALRASNCDVKAFDPVTPAGKVAPVRLCPMGGYVDGYSLSAAASVLECLGWIVSHVYPLSFVELNGSPVMALRGVDYIHDDDGDEFFRMRMTICIPMVVHRVEDFNKTVHDVFGYKREDD